MIERPFYISQLSRAVRRSPITALIGPRQCGKTTLARMFAKGRNAIFFDLESQIDLNRLQNPQLMLGALQDLVIIDEGKRVGTKHGVIERVQRAQLHGLQIGCAAHFALA